MIVNILVLMEVVRRKRAKIFVQGLDEDPEYITALGINGKESFRFEQIISFIYIRVLYKMLRKTIFLR